MKKLSTIVLSSTLLTFGGFSLATGCGSSGTERTNPADDGGGGSDVTFIVPDSGSDIDFKSCGNEGPSTSIAPLYMEIVLDGSGSMGSISDANSKWSAAVHALTDIITDMQLQADPKTSLGMIVFSDKLDSSFGGNYPNAVDVPPAFVSPTQGTLLRNRIAASKTDASGGTPTLKGITGGYNVIRAYTPVAPTPPNGTRVVILMSDGQPDGGTSEQSSVISLAASQLTQNPPIKTFSVGIGPFPASSGYDPNFMGDLAVAGGTRSTPQCQPHATNIANVCHFQITPGGGKTGAQLKQEFIDAINQIRGLAVGCEYSIETTGGIDSSKVVVIWVDKDGNQTKIDPDATDGWTFDNPNEPTKVILHGKSCGDATADKEGQVKIRVGCGKV